MESLPRKKTSSTSVTTTEETRSHKMDSKGNLETNQDRTLRLFENLSLTVYTALSKDIPSKTFASRQVEKLTGYRLEAFRDDTGLFEHLVHPEDIEDLKKALLAATRQHRPLDIEYRLITKNKQTIWIRDRATPIRDKDNSEQMEGVLEDITRQRHTLLSLKKSSQLWQSTFDAMNESITILDQDFRIVQCNGALLRLIDKQASETVGHHCWEVIHGTDHPIDQCPCLKVRQSGQRESTTLKIGHRTILMEVDPHLDDSGGPSRFIHIMTDITEIKRMEQHRLQTEAHLRQAHKMEAIGTLAGGIAHDFNNILSAILGYSELALDDAVNNIPSANYIRQILKAGFRARDLAQQILTFSRQTESKAKPIRIKPIVEEALKLLRASLPTTINIHSDLDSDAIVKADPTQIHQIVMNLCTNASHAMRACGGVLSVKLKEVHLTREFTEQHPGTLPGSHLQMEVGDTGCGIDPGIFDRIFDPYFTTKNKGEGTGMGLAMVHAIVQDLKGAVSMKSQINLGTRFIICLPVIAQKTESPSKPRTAELSGNERILFVDDESALTSLGKQTLERLGYRVTAFTSSTEALSIFENDPQGFDLVITDFTMPQMTGDEMAQRMLDIRPELPIVVCTGYSEKISDDMIDRLGIRALIMKPLVRTEMALAIRKALDGHPGN